MRAFSALLLSLVLAIASVSMAVAHGQARMGEGEAIALCTTSGIVAVVLDADGNPARTAPHLCPDCLSASTAFALPEIIALPLPMGAVRPLKFHQAVLAFRTTSHIAAQARGPPGFSV